MIKGALLQSNYIPWKGYFDIINQVDIFIVYDTVQYTKNDWRNRNRIKTPTGVKWLTIPVIQEKLGQPINLTRVADSRWRRKHWKAICQNYNKSEFFKNYYQCFEEAYLNCDQVMLSAINLKFIKLICELLGIKTEILDASDFIVSGNKSERIVEICKNAGVQHYISGPAARDYIDETVFSDNHIVLSYMDYTGYLEHPQLYPPFDHSVSIIDLIFNTGPNYKQYMKSFS
ncbi:MAG: WbqC family protein [Thermodesulfobacteriota bacterium]